VKVYHVRLSERAKETIEEEIAFTDFESKQGQTGFRESGGWLWSRQDAGWWGPDGLEIVEASGPGGTAEKTWDELNMPFKHVESLDEMFRREGLELSGGWHTHPHGDMPSEVDLKRIGYVLDMRAVWESRTQRALEIIFTRQHGTYEAWPFVFYRGPGGITGRTAIWPEGAILHFGKE
jgi:hypothetical protein